MKKNCNDYYIDKYLCDWIVLDNDYIRIIKDT